MKKTIITALWSLVIASCLSAPAFAQELLVGGQVVGIQVSTKGVLVAGLSEVETADGVCTPAKSAGIRQGDIIIKANGKTVSKAADVIAAVEEAGGQPVKLCIERENKKMELEVRPACSAEGQWLLGMWLRDGISGIGTVTWYDPATGKFGALGHGVNSSGGVLLKMAQGTTYPAQVQSVTKGKSGHPGQLKGSCDNADACGELLRNTPQGVFGRSRQGWLGEPIPIAQTSQIHTGQATIRSTVTGLATGDYSAEILKLYPASRSDGRNLLLKITDPALLEATGGIVQGMSGSPIIQDGRLVGAVTHVLVNDPTVGYGIYIQNMLDAAG